MSAQKERSTCKIDEESRATMFYQVGMVLGFGLVLLLISASQSEASRGRYVIDIGDSHYRSYRGKLITLPVKRMLRDSYPGIRLSDARLKKVVVVAKTNKGRGITRLRVGDVYTRPVRVNGRPWDFENYHRSSFDRVVFRNPSHDSRGPWQVRLKGNFKVRKIVVVLDERPHRKMQKHRSAREKHHIQRPIQRPRYEHPVYYWYGWNHKPNKSRNW